MTYRIPVRAIAPIVALLLVTGGLLAATSLAGADDWSIIGSPNSDPVPTDNFPAGVTCISASDCWAVGWYTSGGTNQTLTEHWDGASWTVVDSPSTGATQANLLRGVACTSSTNCWAVGSSVDDTGTARTLIENWDGSVWSVVPSPNTDPSLANLLSGVGCISSSDCWAVGSALNASFVNRTLTLHWNGSAWSIVTSPNSSASQRNMLNAVTCVSSQCWAVGSHDGSSAEQTLIVQWNGSAWVIATSPNNGTGFNILYGVACSSATDCWAVGNFAAGSIQQTLIVRWNGTLWANVVSPNSGAAQNNQLSAVTCPSATRCWAVGNVASGTGSQTMIELWDGTSWAVTTSPMLTGTNRLNGVACVSSTDCWSVGSSTATGLSQSLTEHWDGSAWSGAPAANGETATHNTLLGVTCVSSSDCWSVASYNNGSVQQTLIEHWDGVAWTIADSPNTGETTSNILYDVACVAANDCWAAGYAAGTAAFQTLTLHWDGTSWSIVASPSTAIAQNNFLNDITCSSSTDCWAVGFYDPGSPYQTLVLHWDGSSWSIIASQNTDVGQDNRLYGVTCAPSSTDCWAVGRYTLPNGIQQTLIERWDGTAWTIVASPNTSENQANYLWSVACAADTDCWTVGSYSQGSGTAKSMIQHWNGAAWTIVPSPNPTDLGFNYIFLRALSCPAASDCWAVGYYFADGHHRTLAEHWDGSDWTIVPTPNSSATQNNYLFGLSCVAPGDCWATGYHYDDSTVFRTMTAHFGIIIPPNGAPLAGLGATPASGVAPASITLDASSSFDSDGTIESYTFDPGDGTGPHSQAEETWSHIYQKPGTFTATVTVTDNLGLQSPEPGTVVVHVAPPAPAITLPLAGAVLGTANVGVSGTTLPSMTVRVFEGAQLLETTQADPSGNFSVTHAFADGGHTVTASATDADGNTSAASSARTFTVDTGAPAPPVLTSPAQDAALNASAVTLAGTADPGLAIEILEGPTLRASTTADDSGRFSVVASFPDGSHGITATATDAAGNTSIASPIRTFLVDTIAPAAPSIIAPASSASVTDSFVTVSGTSEPNVIVTLREGSSVIGNVASDPAGGWRASVGLANGAHTLTATATDAAHNASASSSARTFTVADATPPAAPSFSAPASGAHLDSAQVGMSGHATPGSLVHLSEDGTEVAAAQANESGSWFTSLTLAEGPHSIAARATDPAGNMGPASTLLHLQIDIPADSRIPAIVTPAAASVQPGSVTITGTAAVPPGTSVVIREGSTVLATAVVQPGATWSARADLDTGSHEITAAIGSSVSDTRSFEVDAAPPALSMTTRSNSMFLLTAPLIEGRASDNAGVAAVELRFSSGGSPVLTQTAQCECGAGARDIAWRARPELDPGYYTVQVNAIDRAGNRSIVRTISFLVV